MACSCKTKAKLNLLSLVHTYDSRSQLNLLDTKPKDVKLNKDNSVLYDFSVSTKPILTCTKCSLKHIALALALFRQGTQLNKLIAAGLLMAASYHYNNSLSSLANLALITALNILRNNKEVLASILKLLLLATEAKTNTTIKKEIQQKIAYSPLEAMKHICLAYSLLFTEIFYLKINKGYVVGLLVLAALYLQLQDRSTARHLRLIWKVVQLIKLPNDLDYKNSKAMLERLMLNFNVNVQ